MKTKGNPKKRKKWLRKLPRRKVTRKYGFIPEKKHFCIICWLIDGTINKKKLTVHHHKKRAKGGSNKPNNLEILCEKHHTQLHHPIFYPRVKQVYKSYRKAKFNKIQTT